jgi:hypothetical protein
MFFDKAELRESEIHRPSPCKGEGISVVCGCYDMKHTTTSEQSLCLLAYREDAAALMITSATCFGCDTMGT